MTKWMIGSTAAFVALMVSGCADLPESPDANDETIGTNSQALSTLISGDTDCPNPPGPEFPPGPPTVPLCPDFDDDGVCDEIDFCLGTAIPEDVPARGLALNHFALVNDDLVFDTIIPGGGSDRYFDIFDTGGCSCEQILFALGGRNGQLRNGCSYGTMRRWVRFVNGD